MGHERIYLLLFAVLQFLISVNTSVIKTTLDISESKENKTANLTAEPIKTYPIQYYGQQQIEYGQRPPEQQTEYYAIAPIAINFEEGNYFEGDIILRPDQINEMKSKSLEETVGTLWPKGVLVYDYSDEFSDAQKAVIEKALADLESKTCVRFVRRTTETTYIHLRNTLFGCASQVGYHPKGHVMDLYLNSPGCMRAGTIQHEFLHALGFWHEHTRPDRQKYITIFWDNIIPGREINFRARIQFESHEQLPYDYLSVMHYRALAFSKDHISATIVPKDNKAFFTIGQRNQYTLLDLAKLNVLYKCGPGYYTAGFSSNSGGGGKNKNEKQEEIGSEKPSEQNETQEGSSEEISSEEDILV